MPESHDWADEPSSDSEKESQNTCLMTKIDDHENGEGTALSTALVSNECPSISKVHPFFSLSDSEKIDAFDSLTF